MSKRLQPKHQKAFPRVPFIILIWPFPEFIKLHWRTWLQIIWISYAWIRWWEVKKQLKKRIKTLFRTYEKSRVRFIKGGFVVLQMKCESEAWGAHLLCPREGMIEAGYIGHNGLLIWPQRTHDVYTSPSRRERPAERERKTEWSQSYPVTGSSTPTGGEGARGESGSLFKSRFSL